MSENGTELLNTVMRILEIVVALLPFLIGAIVGAKKILTKWEEGNDAQFWHWAAAQVLTELRELANISNQEITEPWVKDKAIGLWLSLGGDEEYKESFSNFCWVLWSVIVGSSEDDASKGRIPLSSTYRGRVLTRGGKAVPRF